MYKLFFDETANESQTLAGYGCLFIDETSAKKVINEAMENLKNDPDKNKWDEETIKNNYFHACHDSKNAHSHLCNSINKNVRGYFTSFLHKVSEAKLTSEDLYNLARDSVGLNFFDIREEIAVSFEGRNSETEETFNKWYKNLKDKLFPNLYNDPYIETCFPKISFEVHNKTSEAGQICDFILWAAQRHYEKISDIWWNRLKGNLHIKMSSNGKGEPTSLISYDIDFDMPDLPPVYHYDNVKISEVMHDSFQFANLYYEWEQQINIILNNIPESLIHFEKALRNFNDNKMNNPNRIVDGAKLFLSIIDTGKYFYGESHEHIQHLLFMKKWLAFLTIPNNPMTEKTIESINQYFKANNL